ncbi:glycoside hydrolase family 18 [Alicyclobacillus hesperidum URH17-3-68]|nr:glycoside hydrolase family 18 [Alicyclobacillus hesperidum URH17-3-68]
MMLIHVVERGDTLWQLGRMYGVSPEAIAASNGIANPNELVVGQSLVIPTNVGNATPAIRRSLETNAYFVQSGTAAVQEVSSLAPVLTYLSPFSYQAQQDGSISMQLDDTSLLQAARSQGVTPLLVLTNWQGNMFSSDVAHTILTSEVLQNTLIENVLQTMGAKGYRGLNIDFEYVYPQDRTLYNQFLQMVVDRLHREGLLVSSALAPKISATQQGLLYEAHDYPVHGRLCDFVVLMTYEWGWIGGPPMAVSPIDQIRQVLNYAITAIPPAKILMGVSVYGYDWKLPYVSGTRAETLTPLQAVERAAAHQVSILYDANAQAPYYMYKAQDQAEHIVWFEDARSFQAKLDLVGEYNLRGISFWSYPTDFPQVPMLLANRFRVVKR